MADKHIADAEHGFLIVNVTPDFCKVGKKILPFDISQVLESEQTAFSKKVFARGEKVLTVGSVIKGVRGNAGEGMRTGVSLGKGDSQIIEGSSSVLIEGRHTARHLDEVHMNGVF